MRSSGGDIRVHFLPVRGADKKVARRDAELEIAEARAHAAKVVHQRQRDKRNGSRHGSKFHPQMPKPDTGATASETGLVALPVYHLVESGRTGKLDPFVLLAVDMSRQDRDLLHFCEDMSL
jgi:hypothetical protein